MRNMKNFKPLAILTVWIVAMILHGYVKADSTTDTTLNAETAIPTAQQSDRYSIDFEAYAEEAGTYYVEFWMLPAKYPNLSYSQYTVGVNSTKIGTITPKIGNWQGLSLDDNKPINLKKGWNTISVAGHSPEIPMVESIRLSSTNAGKLFASEEYEEYLSNAKKGISTSISKKETAAFNKVEDANFTDDLIFEDVDLEYTFYKIQLFDENQDIFIATSSPIEHDIDMIYLGAYGLPPVSGVSSLSTAVRTNDVGSFPPVISPIRTKLYLPYSSASSAEMQGLNWRGRSEYSLNSTAYLATIHITIPKTGYYVLRVRAREVGELGVADVNINGDYFYEEVPISYSQVPCCIPADGYVYACAVKSDFPLTDDPMLFVQSYAGDRVVGFNDDCGSAGRKSFRLQAFDSYLAQAYNVKTSGISVSSYSSNIPKSTCSIFVRRLDTTAKIPKHDSSRYDGDNPDGYIDGKPYIDLGLPSGTLWAAYNLGADKQCGYGDYFAWGENSTKEVYSWESYKYFDHEICDPNGGIWYATIEIGEDIQSTKYDVATTLWGNKWCMPTEEQLRELRRCCWHEWTKENGVFGVRVHGPNERSIFLPASGIVEKNDGSMVPYKGICGLYWGATQGASLEMPESCNQSAYALIFDSGTFGIYDSQQKCSGISIRPVVSRNALAALSPVENDTIAVRSSGMELFVDGCQASDKIEIHDLSGQLLASGIYTDTTLRLTFPGKGIYIVTVSGEDSVKKMVKLII